MCERCDMKAAVFVVVSYSGVIYSLCHSCAYWTLCEKGEEDQHDLSMGYGSIGTWSEYYGKWQPNVLLP